MLIIFLSLLSIQLFSFQKQNKTGKVIFENNCKSCHSPKKLTEIAPSFQNICKDYGLKWTLGFIKDSRKLRDQGDINALYNYSFFNKTKHISFPALPSKYVIKVLDYVHSFPVDTMQYNHRKLSHSEKNKFAQQQLLIDSVMLKNSSIQMDRRSISTYDTLKLKIKNSRQHTRRYNPKIKQN